MLLMPCATLGSCPLLPIPAANLAADHCAAAAVSAPCRLGMASVDWLGVLTQLKSLQMDFDRDTVVHEAAYPPGKLCCWCGLLAHCARAPAEGTAVRAGYPCCTRVLPLLCSARAWTACRLAARLRCLQGWSRWCCVRWAYSPC